MKAEIIAIGSELLTPDRMDTNSLYLTRKLNEAGFSVHLKSVVGDDIAGIGSLVCAARNRSRLIVLCGGLGPTEDDVTREAVARALGRRLVQSDEVLELLRRRFAKRAMPMPRINERQADVVEGAEILNNPAGTAPGMWIESGDTSVVLLPGPPRELMAMFEAQVVPRLAKFGTGRRLEQRFFSLQGLTESEVDSRISPIYKSYPAIQTTVLASAGIISLRMQCWLEPGVSPSELDELARKIGSELGDVVFTTADEKLEEVVGRILRQSQRTLAVAESCTAGMIGAAITRIPGSSDYFRGGVICYDNQLKTGLCRVPEATLEQYGAVSAEVAEALARGIREATDSSVGLSVTGIAGPGGGTKDKPVGLVYVGIADAGRCLHTRRIFTTDRETMRELTTSVALGRLRAFLLETVA